MKKIIFLTVGMALLAADASAADPYGGMRDAWLREAEESRPVLVETVVRPEAVVRAVCDSTAFQHWRYEQAGSPDSLLYNRNFKDVQEITLDFGKHLTGYFSFSTKTLSRCQDAPVRLRFFFGELPAELNTPLDPWPGTLSRAWMQDETVTVTEVDKVIEIPRRIAFRYLKIQLLGASPDFDFAIDGLQFKALSSAGGCQTSLDPECSESTRRIREVGLETLRECMQTVFEDGPKRDRRLWAGDLYLQALANRHSFRNFDLVKRCLLLFAALADENGIVISNIFETPQPHPQYGSICLNYSLLWNSTLLDYLKDTGDMETAASLWPVARRQVEEALTYVDSNHIFSLSNRPTYAWQFFDWREGLDVSASAQAAVIYAIDQTYELARRLDVDKEVSSWPGISKKMKRAANRRMYDAEAGVYVSGPERQVSLLSQAWMTRAGVADGEKAARALRNAENTPGVVRPGTPYAMHYLVEAMVAAGMHDEARENLRNYWGGMVEKGADTFWESYDPGNDFISAYGFSPVNSACHAWSCTPVYFIHEYPEIFRW